MDFTVEDLVAMRRVEAIAAAPDGTWYAVEVHIVDEETGRYHPAIWRIAVDGEAVPLLEGGCGYRQPRFRADGRLGFLTNRPLDALAEEPEERPGDDARSQVWLRDDDGTLRPLTDEPLGVSGFAFPRRGVGLFVMAPVRPGVPHEQQRNVDDDRRKRGPSVLRYTEPRVRYWDHWIGEAAPHLVVYDGDGDGRRDLTPGADREHREASWDVSPDGTQVAITSTRVNQFGLDDQVLQIVDVASGEVRALYDRPDEVVGAPKFSPDGSRILLVQQRWERGACIQKRLFVIGTDGTGLTELAAGWDRWGDPVGWSSDGRAIVSADDAAEHPLFALSMSGEVERLALPEGAGHLGGVVPAGDGFVGLAHGLRRAPDAFRLEASGEARWLTRLAERALPAATIANLSVPGAGGDAVQYWLLRPEGADGPRPTVVWIHGGPMGAWNDQWHWRWNPNVLLARGYAVVLPNPRGSTGFGQAFVDGIWNNQWGAACYDDLMAVVDAVAGHDGVDEHKIIAMGGSFGGYMTNYLGGHTDRFVGLVTHASLWDLPMFASTTDNPAFWRFQAGADRWGDLPEVERYSPHRFVEHWTTPTLIVHGERDFRVPISEALALYDALHAHDVEAELVVFPDENHWILKPRNIVAWYDACLEFFDRRVAG